MPPRTTESKIVIPRWMWALGITVVTWGGHTSMQLTRVAATSELMLADISSLKEQVWELNGRRTARTAAFSDPLPAPSFKHLPSRDALHHAPAVSIDAISTRRSAGR